MKEFNAFPKMARASRESVITEKIDGTNAQIYIDEDNEMLVGSRKRWIIPGDDNFGFATWAQENKDELMQLGPGRHFGEWWGQGIQRKYGLDEKRFSLFNTLRWHLQGEEPQRIPCGDPRVEKYQEELPGCCSLVPVLYRGEFSTVEIDKAVEGLRENGSTAAPGFSNPEGVICFHIAGNFGLKKTLEKDESPKGMNR